VIIQDDNRAVLPKLPAASIDAVVCDPPYELKRDRRGAGFMGQSWDSDSGAFDVSTWVEIKRVLKPGAWVAAFGGRRTWHRLACAMEDAGLIYRDTFMWAYSTGNVTAPDTTVKPVFEPICVMQVPSRESLAKTVEEYGTGYLNIDDARIPYLDDADLAKTMAKNPGRSDTFTSGVYGTNRSQQKVNPDGRHPSGLIFAGTEDLPFLDVEIDAMLGDFQRFVIVPKASRKERDLGLDVEGSRLLRNPHTAVKPVAMMEWLLTILCPRGGTALDPWIGSGTTGVAAARTGREIIGIERESIFAECSRLRIAHADLQGARA
jgi:site-specific DNA-methyltransferase (adenine-specific)